MMCSQCDILAIIGVFESSYGVCDHLRPLFHGEIGSFSIFYHPPPGTLTALTSLSALPLASFSGGGAHVPREARIEAPYTCATRSRSRSWCLSRLRCGSATGIGRLLTCIFLNGGGPVPPAPHPDRPARGRVQSEDGKL